MELEQGVSLGLGMTIDGDGDVVVLVIVATNTAQIGVPVMPDVTLAFARAMREMAREAQKLQDELSDLEPEEIKDRILSIQQRYSAQAN